MGWVFLGHLVYLVPLLSPCTIIRPNFTQREVEKVFLSTCAEARVPPISEATGKYLHCYRITVVSHLLNLVAPRTFSLTGVIICFVNESALRPEGKGLTGRLCVLWDGQEVGLVSPSPSQSSAELSANKYAFDELIIALLSDLNALTPLTVTCDNAWSVGFTMSTSPFLCK